MKHANAPKGWRKEAMEWMISILIAIAVVIVVNTFGFQLIRVDGTSMTPTLMDNERMFVLPMAYKINLPKHGDVVITHYPERKDNFVKRVVGLPGDVIEVHDGHLFRNGAELEESYIPDGTDGNFGPVTVPEGQVFVMGDNRNDSADSRESWVGPLNQNMLRGKVISVVWPINRWGVVAHGE